MSRWSDLAAWKPTAAHSGSMQEHRGLVLHIAEGFYQGTIAWQDDVANKVSSHFVVGRDPGELAQLVDTDETAWTQRAGNGHWLSAEFAGFTTSHPLHKTHPGWEKLSDWQLESAAQLLARAHHQYAVPLVVVTSPAGRGLGHHSMGGTSWGHLDCPGVLIIGQKQEIIARARKLIAPPTPKPSTGKDDVMTKLPTLQAGDHGRQVVIMQAIANVVAGGSDIVPDGDFGPKTTAIVKQIQAAAALPQTGIVDERTWAALLGVTL